MKKKEKFFKGKILSQMFDIRPTDQAGNLDVEKIRKIKKVVTLGKNEKKKGLISKTNKIQKAENNEPRKRIVNDWLEQNNIFFKEEQERFKKMLLAEKELMVKKETAVLTIAETNKKEKQKKIITKELVKKDRQRLKIRLKKKEEHLINFLIKQRRILMSMHAFFYKICQKIRQEVLIIKKIKKQYYFSLTKISVVVLVILFLISYLNKGLKLERSGLMQTQKAFAKMLVAKDSIKNGNFKQSFIQFNNTYQDLSKVDEEINGLGAIVVDATKYIPYLSKISSGQHLIKAGKDISRIGVLISGIFQKIEAIKKQDNLEQGVAYLKLFKESKSDFQKVAILLQDTQSNLEETNFSDIPEKNRSQFINLKQELPHINAVIKTFLTEEDAIVDILGGNTPRKYLFLFQNNQEMRATGGFIGSYGLLDIFNGKVRQFFVDGVYNPDGQLKIKVVPPVPIQKISAAWSLHDSNWWPNFPTSAEKAIWFYEKEGGPTVDGVVAMTPTVLQNLLKITGPVSMPEYGLVIDKDNFISVIQEQVEVNYDKTLNHPKRILGDLASKILTKLMEKKDFNQLSQLADVILKSLNEKQLLVYSRNWNIEKLFSQNNWGGEILTTPKDYLSVINTNINGFKTDGVIDEKIFHQTQIKEDGLIIDTVIIKRKHNGGNTPFTWWNKVNADYMRVYVPQGSRLISAEGQTREFDVPPLDYNALKFKRDPQIQIENAKIKVDEESGTKIYNEAGKTVFANWVYVSPGETATVKYVYVLPFKITTDFKKPADTYSLLVQKQSGSVSNHLMAEINYPKTLKVLWKYPQDKITRIDNLVNNQKGFKLESGLRTDKFMGVAFSRK